MERDQSTTTVLKRFSWLLTILTGILLAACGSPEKDSVPDGMWVADGYSVEQIAGPDLVTYPMFASLAADGRLFVFESTGPNTMSTEEMLENPTYRISTLFDRDGDGFYDERQTFADSLPLPGWSLLSGEPLRLRLTGPAAADRYDRRWRSGPAGGRDKRMDLERERMHAAGAVLRTGWLALHARLPARVQYRDQGGGAA